MYFLKFVYLVLANNHVKYFFLYWIYIYMDLLPVKVEPCYLMTLKVQALFIWLVS